MRSLRRPLSILAIAALAACGPQDESTRDPAIFAQQDGLTACGQISVKGLDVSAYQGSYQGSGVHVDWNAVAGAGYKFAVARISDGTATIDPDFSYNWSHIKSAGMIRGAYQFFRPSVSATAQANLVVSTVGQLGNGDLPVTLDVEVATPTVSEITTWANIVEAGTGKKPIIYTASGLWNSWISGGLESYPLWVANYTSCTPNTSSCCPSMPHNWTGWVMWQYTSSSGATGVSGNVDHDFFNGTLADLQAFAGATDCGGKANGYWCAGDGPTGPAGTLYKCANNVATPEETCPSWCATGASGDFCARTHRPQPAVDIDDDGRADVCGRSSTGFKCYLAGSGVDFSQSVSETQLSNGAGWNGLPYYTTTAFADVDGDGKADLCARGAAGAMCWLGTGSGFGNPTAQTLMTDAAGWDQPEFRQTIQWADVNGDGKADLCGRQYASFSCWLYSSTSNAFSTERDVPDMGDPQGWNQVQYYSTIVVADVTGDGKADVCGRGYAGFECFTAKSGGFNGAGAAVTAFSDPNGGDKASVYSTLALGDVTGDGKPDICGRISSGYRCYKGNGDGTFSGTAMNGPALSNSAGWNKAEYYTTIQLADVNGDGKADVCARDNAGIKCWLSTGTGFGGAIAGPALSDAAGWSSGVYASSIHFADIDGDGRADVCGRAINGWNCWLSTGNGFDGTAITPNILTDASGWDKPQYLTTVELVGNAFGRYVPSSTSGSSGSTGASTTAGTTGNTDSGSGSGSTTTTTTTTTGGSDSGSSSSGTSGTGDSGSSTAGTTGGASAGTTGEGGTVTSGSPGSGGTSGDTVGGGCSSTSGSELLALFAVLGLVRRRRA